MTISMMMKIIFLDRDGVINKNRSDYVKNPSEFHLIKGVENWLKILVNMGFKLVIITNQSMIGRKIASLNDLEEIHLKMQNSFKKDGFQIDKIYFCPHTPFDNCECRKPNIKLFEKAIADFNIDVKNSWLIGDKDSDIVAGKRIGCKTIKIETDSSLENSVMRILSEDCRD